MTLDDIDLTSLDQFEAGFPHEIFAELRRQEPVWWHHPTANTPDDEGFWVISAYEPLMEVVRDADRFSSETGPGRDGKGGTLIEDLPDGITGTYLHVTDDPHHGTMRKLVSAAFTPRAVDILEAGLKERAARLIDEISERGECDYLADVARELPLQVIAEMIGVPQEDRHQLFESVSTMLDYRDHNLGEMNDELAKAGAHMFQYGADLIARRRKVPTDDLFSNVVHATIEEDGSRHQLSDEELHGFFNLLFAAGSETTRNAIAGGLLALMQHPSQLRDLRDDPSLMKGTVEEILRWTSPVLYNRRTATCDTELAGAKISAGEKTTHWYPSANRDAGVFTAADTFDIRRQHNPHVAFGHGAHFCIGANLARREIAVLLEAVLSHLDDFELAGEVRYSRSNKHMGMQTMPIRFRRRNRGRGER